MFRPEDFAELLLRLRPLLRLRAIALALRVGLALRATPSAPNRKGNIFFMARPPLLCEEGTGDWPFYRDVRGCTDNRNRIMRRVGIGNRGFSGCWRQVSA